MLTFAVHFEYIRMEIQVHPVSSNSKLLLTIIRQLKRLIRFFIVGGNNL